MHIIKESPEHHFLTVIDKVRTAPAGWEGMHFKLSKKLVHNDIIADLSHIKGKLYNLNKEAGTYMDALRARADFTRQSYLYLFSDFDIILLAKTETEEERKKLYAVFKELAGKVGVKVSSYSDLSKDLYSYQKLADARFLGSYRVAAYTALSDSSRVASIPLRRQRREDPLVMVVEDDRFTASYAASILNKEYEMVLAKTGEEAISHYIEYAPDIVFLDIHLPGLSGHDTLKAIRKADPDSYIIMLSVDAAKVNVVGATQSGAAGFLKKPFTKERMLHVARQSPFVKRLRSGI